jgi:hypothetical protein
MTAASMTAASMTAASAVTREGNRGQQRDCQGN